MKQTLQRRTYEKPAMRVIILPGRQQLLQASKRGPYDPIDTNPFGG